MKKRGLSDGEWDAIKKDGEGCEETVVEEKGVIGECMREIKEMVKEGGELFGVGG